LNYTRRTIIILYDKKIIVNNHIWKY